MGICPSSSSLSPFDPFFTRFFLIILSDHLSVLLCSVLELASHLKNSFPVPTMCQPLGGSWVTPICTEQAACSLPGKSSLHPLSLSSCLSSLHYTLPFHRGEDNGRWMAKAEFPLAGGGGREGLELALTIIYDRWRVRQGGEHFEGNASYPRKHLTSPSSSKQPLYWPDPTFLLRLKLDSLGNCLPAQCLTSSAPSPWGQIAGWEGSPGL